MAPSQNLIVFAYLISGLLPLLLLYPVSRNWESAGAVGMVITIAGVSIWGFAGAFHTAVSSPDWAFAAWNALLLGASLSIVGWFLVLGTYTGLISSTRRVVGVLALEPILLQAFAWTNPAHHLVYGEATSFTAVTSIVSNYQPVFWIHAAVGYGLNSLAGLVVLSQVVNARGVRRTQSFALFASLIPPTITNVVHLVAETSFDLTPFGFVGTVFILGWALYRAQLLDIIPIGRERAIENMTDAAVTVDTNGRVVDCNPAARELVSVGSDYAGMPAAEFFSQFPEAVERFRDTTAVETEISVTQNGSERHFDLDISPIYDLAGEREGRLVVLREITLLKQREQELRERQQDLDLLRQVQSRVLRHNIRNDLTVVKAYTELFATEFDGERERMARTVLSKADDLVATSEKARVVERLIEEDQRPVTLDVAAMVTTVVADCRSRFPDVTVSVDCPDHCVETVVPALETALKNVVENAAKHNDSPNPMVEISLAECDDGSRLTVSDNGPGLPEQELRVLEQGEETPMEHASGLGLWIADRVVRKSDVSIDYEVDDGTTVELHIPG